MTSRYRREHDFPACGIALLPFRATSVLNPLQAERVNHGMSPQPLPLV
jgi:hypothetical protein